MLSARVVTSQPRRSGRALLLRLASQFAKVGVSAVALFLVVRQVDAAEMMKALSEADRTDVLCVVAIYLVGQALTAWRWRMIAARVGFSEPLSDFVRYYFIGMFFNNFGPSTLGGDVVRALYLGASAGRRAVALHTVFFDRLSGLVMLVFVAVGAVALFGNFGLPWPMIAMVIATGIAMGAGWFLLPPLARRFLAPDGRVNRLVERDLKPFWNDRELLTRTAGISVGFHLLQCSSLILLGNAVGMNVDWRYYYIFHPLVSVLSALPVSVAGLGIREAGYVWFLKRQGIDGHTAMAFGILWFAVLLASSAVGGIVYLWSGAAVPTLRAHPKHAPAAGEDGDAEAAAERPAA
jgi:glycosyltransferase 2 family protein